MKTIILDAWVLFWLLRISIEDARSFTIPNGYTLAVLAAAPFLFSIPVQSRLLAAVLPFALVPLMGMGDVKLYGALGFSLGLRGLLQIACLSMLAGGLYAAVLLAAGKVKHKDRLAFGPFIAGAAALILICYTISGSIPLLSGS